MFCRQNLQHKAEGLWIEPFYFLVTNLLSLLLPLSFLLLARVSCAHYLFASYFHFSFFMYTSPVVLYVLVSTISISTFIHGLTGKILSESPGHRLYLAWILLCSLQICVGLGIEGSIAVGVNGSSFGIERSLFIRVIFFLGLHQTMLLWFRTVVKAVVDDTIFGASKEERWVEKVGMALTFSGLWWWNLRDEVESLVAVAETKKDLLMSVGVADSVGWWLYYQTATIGMVRLVKGLLWLGMMVRRNSITHPCDVEDKV